MKDEMKIDMADKIGNTTSCSEDDTLEDIRIYLAEAARYANDLSSKCEKYGLPACCRLGFDRRADLEDLTKAPDSRLYGIASEALSEGYGERVKDICHVEAVSPTSLVCYGIEWDFDTIDREDGPPARRQQPTT